MPSPKQKNSIVTPETINACGMSKDMVNGDDITPYYERFRRDAIAAVPPTAKYVLSVGCASGVLLVANSISICMQVIWLKSAVGLRFKDHACCWWPGFYFKR
jgi:hypothetical protein